MSRPGWEAQYRQRYYREGQAHIEGWAKRGLWDWWLTDRGEPFNSTRRGQCKSPDEAMRQAEIAAAALLWTPADADA